MVIRSLMYGYLGAAGAGLAIALVGTAAGLSQETIVTLSSPAGIACGLFGLGYAWRHQVFAFARAAAAGRLR